MQPFFPSSAAILLSSFFLLFSFLCLFFFFLQWRMRQNQPHYNLLPPGSLGWPYIGETLKLYTESPNTFFSSRHNRYGDIFKTHILGCPSVMISRPEAIKTVLVSQAHLFKPTYPPSKEKLIGPEAVFFHQGEYHSMLKKLIQSSFLPNAIRGLVPEIEQIVLNFLPSWENSTINTLEKMKKFAFEVAMFSVFGGGSDIDKDRIKHLYLCLESGYNSMPLNLPGTLYRKSVEARTLLNEALREVIQNRRERVDQDQGGGLLGTFLRYKDDQLNHLSDSQISDNIIGVIFAAHDTTASALTWIIKYLHDHEDLLDVVTREQEGIRREINEEQRELTWDDTRRMPLTSRLIQETLRRASIISFTFREAVEDVELDGFIIPKGWKVLPLFRIMHHYPDFFPQPEKFDPSRFQVPPKPNTYMPFGSGVHSCPGNELAKLEALILLNHLTATYRWKVVGENEGIQYIPFPVPKRGLPIKVTARSNKKEL